MGNAVLTHGLDADTATLREFLRLAGAPDVDEGPLSEEVANGVRRAHGGRLPGEARPALAILRDAGVPALVASGGHAPALERICDALAIELHAERLGLSLWELPAGEAAYPYHYHLAEEELLLVLDGRPSLRTPDGWRDLQQGEVVAFLRGEHGAHQLVNHTENTVRFLAFSTSGEPDIVIRPDSGTLGAYERLPNGSGLRAVFRMGDNVDYYDGEQPPAKG